MTPFGPGRAVTTFGLVVIAGLLACRPAEPDAIVPPQVDPRAEVPAVLEGLFATGRYGEVVTLSTQALASTEDREQAARLRFLRALARLSQPARSDHERGLAELRELELCCPELVWGRMAELHVAEVTRAEVLRESLLLTGGELRQLLDRIRQLEQELAEAKAAEAHRQSRLATAEADREQLRKQLEEAQAKAAAQAKRIAELEEELAALKRIDMAREP